MIELAIVFLPLIAAMVAGLNSGSISVTRANWITCSSLVVSALLSIVVFYDVAIQGNVKEIRVLTWFLVGNLDINWSIYIDSLTAVMLLVVTGVSALVHIYSVGYMHDDPHRPRFMAYLSLFTFFMLVLVTSDNLLQLFVGWEGVGLCSYLLIGFWYKKPAANAAAIKAFVVNRVGDFGFMLGVIATFLIFGSIQFDTIFSTAPSLANHQLFFMGQSYHALTVVCVLLFIGAMGKSAQFGLHTWLPDAMEGPTPVSALIHAATMVTAGVFLVARCSPLFELSPFALELVTVVGAVTCLFAATIAITQNDIKRIIAYSTCSQLGYMFFACGVSAYSAGIFHLMTHGFFKALLFLGAGSVIHAMSHEQDIRKMGGIWKHIPVTYAMMWIGSLALAGVWPFAGFYSKDMVLEAAYAAGEMGQWSGSLAFWFGIVAAFLTAFYSWRLIILVFHGKPRASQQVMEHIHESPNVILLPLIILAVGSIVTGYVGYAIWHMVSAGTEFWNGALVVDAANNILDAAHNVPLWVKFLPLAVGAGGILLAYICYMLVPSIPTLCSASFKPIYNFLLNKWFIDELYNAVFVKPAKTLGRVLWRVGDIVIIDGLGPNGLAWLSQQFAGVVKRAQTGFLYHYAFVMLIGLIVLISWFVINSSKILVGM